MPLSLQDEEILRTRIRPLVTAELLERFGAKPTPPYDADIVEVLDFVRRNPDPDRPRYLIVRESDGFVVARRSLRPGAPPEPIPGPVLPDRGAAELAVLVFRLRDYGIHV